MLGKKLCKAGHLSELQYFQKLETESEILIPVQQRQNRCFWIIVGTKCTLWWALTFLYSV